jgi:CDP-glucose 4,6-dehydratase
VIVASSDKAYGPSAKLPYVEDQPLDAVYPYDASKAAADVIARSYWHTYGLPIAVTRFANLYGGGDLNASRLVPESVWAALAGRRPVIRSDGTPQRDFLYVEDAVGAYLAIAEALDRAGGEAFNAGGGRPHAVLEIVKLVFAAAGAPFDPDIRGSGTPAGELDRQYVDHSKLTALTGWQPQVGLDEGLRRTVEWYRRYAPTVPELRSEALLA